MNKKDQQRIKEIFDKTIQDFKDIYKEFDSIEIEDEKYIDFEVEKLESLRKQILGE